MSVTGHIIGNWNLTGEVNETGEGANVVPNPPEEATETLEKIGIDDVVYSITGEQEQADWDQADPTAVDYIKNKPTIPAAQVNSDWEAESGVAEILNKPTLSAVATSGDASDVSYDNTTSGMTATDVQEAVDELKSNLSQLDGLTVYKNLTPQTSYADFDDGSTLPLISLTSNIDPIQDLHGYDRPWVGGSGKNKFNAQKIVTDSNHPGETYIENGYLKFRTGEAVSIGFVWDSINLSCPLTFHGKVKNFGNATNNVRMDVTYSDNSTERIIIANGLSALEEVSFSVVIGDSGKTLSQMKNAWTNELKAGFNISTTQLEAGNQATSYEPYSNICPISGFTEAKVVVSPTADAEDGTTYTIQFKDGSNSLTVYGGTLDVVSGELTVTDEYIASYNGETLPSTWISDRDVYAEGTTPTTGAEVVYELATPQTYQLTPTQVNSLLGQNYISSDTGNITNVKYLGILNLS